jgi:hypothetical protein
MYTTENTTKAFYINERRNIIGIEMCNSDGNWEGLEYIAADADDPLYQNLLQTYTVDELEAEYQERLIRLRREEDERILALVNAGDLNSDRPEKITDFQGALSFLVDFANHPEDDKEEELFNLKLAAFEMEAIENSDDDSMKEGLRTAEDPLTLLNRISAAIQS